jgi:orotate phosphoribosyltransferase
VTVPTFLTYYMDNAVFHLPDVIRLAQENLAGVDFDTIVGTGLSGSIVVPALALAMEKKFLLIRKDGDDSHHGSGRPVGELGLAWVFVDDFISTGRTRRRVIEKVAGSLSYRNTTSMVGQYMYQRLDGKHEFEPFRAEWREVR